jgi:ATP synthase protein I
MSEKPTKKAAEDPSAFSRAIGSKAARKIKAKRSKARGVWFGLGMMGLVGWSVMVPTLLGAGAGFWLDRHYPQSFSWILTLLITGLFIGCLIAWRWVSREYREICEEEEEEEEEQEHKDE